MGSWGRTAWLVAEACVDSGFRRLLFVNGHVGNSAALWIACDRFRREFPELRVGVMQWWDLTPDIARRATDPFSCVMMFGIVGMIFTHIVENIGMTIGIMPITGIPLPFFSYGGSFLLACFMAVGISLRVAWESRQSGYAEL